MLKDFGELFLTVLCTSALMYGVVDKVNNEKKNNHCNNLTCQVCCVHFNWSILHCLSFLAEKEKFYLFDSNNALFKLKPPL